MLPRSMKRVRGATFQKTELKITVLSASPAALAVTSNWILSCQIFACVVPPRWAAKGPMVPVQENRVVRIYDCFAAERG